MPPEAFDPSYHRVGKAYSADSYSFGIIALFTIGDVFPREVLPLTSTNENDGEVFIRTELEQREQYMVNVRQKLVGLEHVVSLIERCISTVPSRRPMMKEVAKELAPFIQKRKVSNLN